MDIVKEEKEEKEEKWYKKRGIFFSLTEMRKSVTINLEASQLF